jgi:hypothetical protein
LILRFELPHDYPNTVPNFRVKNLSFEYLDNKLLDKFETEMKKKAEESLGSLMIFELANYLKSELTEMNDGVVNALKLKEDEGKVENALKVSELTSKKLSYTPVNEETFAKWCAEYKERLRLEKSARLTEIESKPTGKQLFLASKQGLDDLTIEDEEETETVTFDEATQEENKEDSEEGEEGEDEEADFKYDRALYDADGLEEEDVEFDDD